MRNLETNKLFAALLIALFVERLTSILSTGLVHPTFLEKPAYLIEGVEKTDTPLPASPQGPESIEPLLATANLKNGEHVAKKCLQCHTFDKGGPNRVGPNLYAVFGEKIGAHEGYPYSKAFKEKEGVWDDNTLNIYLYKPRSFVPGTKMSFAGVEKTQDRADLILYLRSLTDTPHSLPTLS